MKKRAEYKINCFFFFIPEQKYYPKSDPINVQKQVIWEIQNKKAASVWKLPLLCPL